MSGLDGLGWPNPEDEPKPNKTMNSQLEIKLAPTPETDAMEYCDAMCDPDRVVEADFARKLERERDEWQINALLKLAVKQLACMWCGELVHAPTGYEPSTPLNAEQRAQAYQQHVATCPAHPIRDVERERDRYQESADALVDRLGATQERMINAERERNEWKAKYIQQNKDLGCEMMDPNGTIWDYAKKVQRELTVVTKQRDNFEERLRVELGGHPDSELWGDTGLIAATMRCVDALDAVTEQRDRLAEAIVTHRAKAFPLTGEDFDQELWETLQSINQPNEL